MTLSTLTFPHSLKLSENDFLKISQFIQERYGIKLPIAKLILVESRLLKRVTALNIKNFSDYVKYVFSSEGLGEQEALIDFISTNKTEFFREINHFRFLENYIIRNKISRPLQIWSAACSSGEEPYSISMTLEEVKLKTNQQISHSILATDISHNILTKAIKGEYAEKSLEMIPQAVAKKYFRVTNGIASINADIRKPISFRRFNLVDDHAHNFQTTKFDFIFCRNVLIYFDPATQEKVVKNLIRHLTPEGHLFLGHSETLFNKNLPVTQIQPTIYQKRHE